MVGATHSSQRFSNFFPLNFDQHFVRNFLKRFSNRFYYFQLNTTRICLKNISQVFITFSRLFCFFWIFSQVAREDKKFVFGPEYEKNSAKQLLFIFRTRFKANMRKHFRFENLIFFHWSRNDPRTAQKLHLVLKVEEFRSGREIFPNFGPPFNHGTGNSSESEINYVENSHLLALSNIEIFFFVAVLIFRWKKNFHFIFVRRQLFSSTSIAKNRSLLFSLGNVQQESRKIIFNRENPNLICRCWRSFWTI